MDDIKREKKLRDNKTKKEKKFRNALLYGKTILWVVTTVILVIISAVVVKLVDYAMLPKAVGLVSMGASMLSLILALASERYTMWKSVPVKPVEVKLQHWRYEEILEIMERNLKEMGYRELKEAKMRRTEIPCRYVLNESFGFMVYKTLKFDQENFETVRDMLKTGMGGYTTWLERMRKKEVISCVCVEKEDESFQKCMHTSMRRSEHYHELSVGISLEKGIAYIGGGQGFSTKRNYRKRQEKFLRIMNGC